MAQIACATALKVNSRLLFAKRARQQVCFFKINQVH